MQAPLYHQKSKQKHPLGDEFTLVNSVAPQRVLSQSRNQPGSNTQSKGAFGALEFVRIMKRKVKKRKFTTQRSNSLAHKEMPYARPILAKPLIWKQQQGQDSEK